MKQDNVDDKLEEILVNLIEAGFEDAFRIVAEKKKPSRDDVVSFLTANVGEARQKLDQYYADFYRNKIPEINGETSDGHHTFNQLYSFRMLYNAAFFNELWKSPAYHTSKGVEVCKSWRHSDGELPFGKDNYFVVVAQLPAGQISNHYKGQYWDLFKIPEVAKAPEWDGHTPQDVEKRLTKYITAQFNSGGSDEDK